MKNKNTK